MLQAHATTKENRVDAKICWTAIEMLTQTIVFVPLHRMAQLFQNNLKFSEHVAFFLNSLAPNTIQLFHFNPHAVCVENMVSFFIFYFPLN